MNINKNNKDEKCHELLLEKIIVKISNNFEVVH